MSRCIRVVLADDHDVVRQSARSILDGESEIDVIDEAENGVAAIERVNALQPDVLVLDLIMPGLNGLDVIHELQRRRPRTAIVVLSMCGGRATLVSALRRGALGYVLKSSTREHLAPAIRAAAEGRRYVAAPLSLPAMPERLGKLLEDPLDRLTPRERDVLRLVAMGLTSTEIATHLGMGRRTAEWYRANLTLKGAGKRQSELVRFALERGLVDPWAPAV
jgi:two-component system, NarL family, response regulator NreC